MHVGIYNVVQINEHKHIENKCSMSYYYLKILPGIKIPTVFNNKSTATK